MNAEFMCYVEIKIGREKERYAKTKSDTEIEGAYIFERERDTGCI